MGLRMTDAAARKVENRFDNLAEEFWELKSVMDTAEGEIVAGAGELSGWLSRDVSCFALGWRKTFDISSTSAAVIAGNTNRLNLDLEALDRDASHELDLDLDI